MVQEAGVLLDVSGAGEEGYKRIIEFANSAQALMWSSPFEQSGIDGGWSGRKKLIVVAPRTAATVTEFLERII